MFANMTVCESIFRSTPIWARKAYLTFVGIAVFYLPLILIAVAYIRIFLKIASRANENSVKATSSKSAMLGTHTDSNSIRRQGSRSRSGGNSENDTGGGGGGSWVRKTSRSGLRHQPVSSSASLSAAETSHGRVSVQSTSVTSFSRARSKTFKMTVVIVGAFVAFGLPYHILEMIYSYGDHKVVSAWLAALLGSMAVANSAVNPFVFLIFSVDARFCYSLLRGKRRGNLITGSGGLSSATALSRDRGRRRPSPAVTRYSFVVQSESEAAACPPTPQSYVTSVTLRNKNGSSNREAGTRSADKEQQIELMSLMHQQQPDRFDGNLSGVANT
jgi:hypothetical protein